MQIPHHVDRLAKTFGYYLAFITLGLASAILGPTLPGLAEHTGSRLSEVSYLFTARSAGYLLGSLRGGSFYDRIKGHWLLTVNLIVLIVMMVLTPVIPALWLLLLVMFVFGTAEGLIDVGGNTLLVWVHREQVGPFMNGLHFFYGLGAFLAPVAVAQALLVTNQIYWAYWVLAFAMLPGTLWIFLQPSPRISSHAQDGQAGRVDYWFVGLLVMFFFLYTGGEVAFGGWIYTYAVRMGLSDKASAAYLTSVFWGALTLGRLLSIPVAIRLKPYLLVLLGLVGGLISIGSMVLFPTVPEVLWAGTFGLGVSLAPIFPSALAWAGSRMAITGKITGFFFSGASSGAIFLPWLIGQFIESSGPVFVTNAIFAEVLLGLVAFAGLYIYTRRSMLEQVESVKN